MMNNLLDRYSYLDEFYSSHILSKEKWEEKDFEQKYVVDLYGIRISEYQFVQSMKPTGWLSNFIIDAVCAIWREEEEWRDKIILSQPAVRELLARSIGKFVEKELSDLDKKQVCAFLHNFDQINEIYKRSLGEPFSRQIRLKSSDMPESSQNGSASEISEIQDYDKAMGELINKVDDGTYVIAGQCLRDPKILQSYSHIPTIERKISFLHGTWRVMHEPKCVLENLQPADQLFVRSPNS
ncbi:hypothetical protein ACP70R_037979 [Stipagrostis hirtigluma subsp. patula]